MAFCCLFKILLNLFSIVFCSTVIVLVGLKIHNCSLIILYTMIWCIYMSVYIYTRGAVVEWYERLVVVRKVAGSSPARAKRLENSRSI